jgi:hypothetical protein
MKNQRQKSVCYKGYEFFDSLVIMTKLKLQLFLIKVNKQEGSMIFLQTLKRQQLIL